MYKVIKCWGMPIVLPHEDNSLLFVIPTYTNGKRTFKVDIAYSSVETVYVEIWDAENLQPLEGYLVDCYMIDDVEGLHSKIIRYGVDYQENRLINFYDRGLVARFQFVQDE